MLGLSVGEYVTGGGIATALVAMVLTFLYKTRNNRNGSGKSNGSKSQPTDASTCATTRQKVVQLEQSTERLWAKVDETSRNVKKIDNTVTGIKVQSDIMMQHFKLKPPEGGNDG